MSARDEEIVASRRRADRNAHGHIAQALRLKLLDDVATFVATIGGAVIMAGGAVILGSDHPQHAIEAAIALGGGLITLVGVWQAVWRPGERSRQHKDWAMRFTQVEDDCRLVLCGESQSTPRDLLASLNDLATDADLVAERLWRRWRATGRRQDLARDATESTTGLSK